MNFIPAKESRFIIWFFYQYTSFLLKRRFRNVIINQQYKLVNEKRTVYFINHFYWWDGLLPLYLNNKIFGQTARALMEDKQMKKYPFFSKIGAFSINLEDTRSTIHSLRYALQSLARPNSSLFIYPQGKIVPVSYTHPNFKPGLAWLYQHSSDIDFVPIAFYIDHSKHHKPDLYISIGESVLPNKTLSKKELTKEFELKLTSLLTQIRADIHS